ncbi:MAG: hypothetical protein IKU26_08700, partial [Clostridia bacterium]|nr:hypothetical protein [Clostridia bacterium]
FFKNTDAKFENMLFSILFTFYTATKGMLFLKKSPKSIPPAKLYFSPESCFNKSITRGRDEQ